MKLIYKYSKINNDLMDFAKPYNRKPTMQEVREANKNKKIVTKDGLIIFGGETNCEVRMVIGNGITSNRYNDIYYLR